MKMKLFTVFLLITGNAVKAQSTINKCEAINFFIGTDSVRNLFQFDANKISYLYAADTDKTTMTCQAGYGNNHSFKWTSDSTMCRALKAGWCNYYAERCVKSSNGWQVEISQACSKLVCQGEVKRRNRKLSAFGILAFVR